jgi:hypothetical protein
VIRNQPVIDTDDAKLARELLAAMASFRERLDSEGTDEQRDLAEATMDFDYGALAALTDDDRTFLTIRSELIQRIELILRAEDGAGGRRGSRRSRPRGSSCRRRVKTDP